ncbi:hypothetical protein E2F48_00605 [Arthrobacter crusticola]|uniref:Uncharacterized protein n=1 Tax=Arthrobacter crusticola TaxID=2547960 RepID=A0A4R5U231_9MICC|nr:hypothetical protein [Arthrobacter crusticola]TDK27677.1 hypothetical protein E2F48_00605 [Arthrobacter crusticola]
MSASHSSWHGIPPPADRFTPSVQLEQPAEGVHWTREKAPPLWADLAYENKSKQTVKGIAMAWTKELVWMQWIEHSKPRHAGVEAGACRRREIPQRNLHRDG